MVQKLSVAVILLCFLNLSACDLTSSLPAHLVPCYRGGGGAGGSRREPRRLDVFLELLRKMEASRPNVDMRVFSAALLRSYRLDGIEQSQNTAESEHRTPYRASGFQFHRYRLLLDLLLPSQDLGEWTLTSSEGCSLHRMMSGTVRRWERGDEDSVCPMRAETARSFVDPYTGRAHSRCPIEDGVMLTPWGTVAAGTLVAAVATSLQPQTVPLGLLVAAGNLTEGAGGLETMDEIVSVGPADISNIHVATLAGDLAEVAVNQGPRSGAVARNIIIGSNNRWNDTELPRIYYIFPQNESIVQWHITDAEILAGIDGLILAKEIPKWTSKFGSLRLSQVIEMYYSNDDVNFDVNIKACKRNTNFHKIFDPKETLREVTNFAQMLALSQVTVYVPNEEVNKICDNVVTAFTDYVNDVVNRNQFSCEKQSHVPAMNLIVATDAAWKKYQNEQFISSVALSADLLSRQSTLGFIHGNTGKWIVPPVENVTGVFENIQLFTDEWPNRLNLKTILSSLNVYLTQERVDEDLSGASVALPTVILIASTSDRLTSEDLETSRDLMRTIRHTHFDIHFIFLAQDLTSFYDLNTDSNEYADLFLEVKSTNVEEAARKIREELPNAAIPKRIIGNICDTNVTQANQVEYEDFISVDQIITYRIHPKYLHATQLVSVTFRATVGGEVIVCSARQDLEGQQHCQKLGERQQTTFNITEPCARSQQCAPVYFTVTGVSTLNTCANSDCRSPSQISFTIRHSGLQCLSLYNRADLARSSTLLIPLCSFFLLFYSLHYLHVK